ncbi:MAG: efflux RND transporter permease subunit [Pirellulales bacterium]|nr:efflux RND transporter permease subunit [Pirellulales bacterium]
MKALVRWAIGNMPAMNTLMVTILLVGAASVFFMRREVFPEFDLDFITVTVPYPGATPAEVEEGICQKIEEAVQAIAGIKKITSIAREGAGTVLIELESNIPDVQRVLNEVRSDVDRIPSFPELAEDPEVQQITLRNAAIRVGVLGPEGGSEKKLRDEAEKIRDAILLLPSVSQAELVGTKEYQIDVEISEETLRKYGLTLQDVANIIRRGNIEMPGGTMRTESQEVLLRGKNKQLTGEGISQIPLITQSDGVVLTVGDLGVVRDAFNDTTAENFINGKPGMVINVQKVSSEDLLAITDEVRHFVDTANQPGGIQLPHGYSVACWSDVSIMVKDRLELLGRNGLQGLILVFVVLTLFLQLRLAFWVAAGVPISILGACAILFGTGQTLNMISMFAFLTALGILVDDAIVVGENVYAHHESGKDWHTAAVDGTYEVIPSVIASVMTTIIAFTPLLFVPGILGKFFAVMPFAVIVMLIISLLESTFVLPCHLAHGVPRWWTRYFTWIRRPGIAMAWSIMGVALWGVIIATVSQHPVPGWKIGLFGGVGLFVAAFPQVVALLVLVGRFIDWLNHHVSSGLEKFINRGYTPLLRWTIRYPGMVLSAATALLLVTVSLFFWGAVPFNAFPKLDSDSISAQIMYPDGTPAAVTEAATKRLEDAIWKVNKELSKKLETPGDQLVQLTHRAVGHTSVTQGRSQEQPATGSHVGAVGVELLEAAKRQNIKSVEVTDLWRKYAGQFPGAESVTFGARHMGPGGKAIEFKLLAKPEHMADLEAAAEACKEELKKKEGVFDIADDSQPGKWEYQLKVKDEAQAMGNSEQDVAGTVRAAYYGQEVMRLQRGRHEVKLMVRYPEEERRRLSQFDEVRIRTAPSVKELIQGVIAQNNGNSSRFDRTRSAERPLTELADVDVQRGYSQINRADQLRSITITADLDEKVANAEKLIGQLKTDFMPKLFTDYPDVRVRWEGQNEQTRESVAGLMVGLGIALLAMFVLLTLEFTSYLQPLLIMAIIPFGIIGAIYGHLILRMELTLFSLFGLVALTGVVVNDSIVLIDFINHRIRGGIPLEEALVDAGRRRFRPVLLTSVTTIVGLMPILLEKSFQAQVLIPMATSLCFGLMLSTIMVLVLVPAMYMTYYRLTTSRADRADAEREPAELDEFAEPPELGEEDEDEDEAPGSIRIARSG